jgi:hypothetical protein
MVSGSYSFRFVCSSAPPVPRPPPGQRVVTEIQFYFDASCEKLSNASVTSVNPLFTSSGSCAFVNSGGEPVYLMAASCGADAAVNFFQDPQCQRYAATITQPNNMCSSTNPAPGSASMRFVCFAQSTPTEVMLRIADDDRVAAKAQIPVTLAFTATAALAINGSITLSYPSGFFATTATPANNAAGTASVASMTAFSSAPNATQIVISTRVAGIPAATAFTITLSGLTMGAATAGNATGITVSTDADTVASAGVPSGTISTQPTGVVFTIAAGNRVAAKAQIPVTLAFTATAALAINGSITLSYPSGFFATTATPANNAAGTASVASMTAFSSAPNATQIVISTRVAGIPAATAFTITLSGLTMGAATAGNATGITVSTDADTVASAGVPSGTISTQPTGVVFTIAAGNRVAAKAQIPVTLAFTATAALAINGSITLSYPSGFFATTATPANNAAGTASVASMTAFSSAPNATQIVISTRVAGIPASHRLHHHSFWPDDGTRYHGGFPGITVSTSADPIASAGVQSGSIGGQVTSVSLAIDRLSRVAGKTGVSATLLFTTTAGGVLHPGSNITFAYPAGFFVTASILLQFQSAVAR